MISTAPRLEARCPPVRETTSRSRARRRVHRASASPSLMVFQSGISSNSVKRTPPGPLLGHQRNSQEPQKPMATPSTAPAKTWMGVWPSSSLSSFPKSSGFISVQCSIM